MSFLLLWRLAKNRDDLRQIIKPVCLAKIVIIQGYHPRLFRLMADGPHHLIDLERRFGEQERRDLASQGESPLSCGARAIEHKSNP